MQLRRSPSGPFVDIPLGGSLSVANIAALATLPDDDDIPDWVWVETVLCAWHRNRTSTLTPDGITVVAALGGGRWERCVPTTAPDWLAQATWYLDPVNGNDEGNGSLSAPLRSGEELDRRLSVGPLGQDTRIVIPAGAFVANLNLTVDTNGWLLTLAGTATVTRTSTIGTYVDRTHVTPEVSLLTDPTVLDWTPEIWSRCRVTGGAQAGAMCWIGGASPGGVGLGTAAVSRFVTPPSNANTWRPAAVDPADGSAYVVESLPTIGNLTLNQRPGRAPRSVTQQTSFWVQDIIIGNVSQARCSLNTQPLFRVIVDGCVLDASVYGQGGQVAFTRCRCGDDTSIAGVLLFQPVDFRGCLLVKEVDSTIPDVIGMLRCLGYGNTGTNGYIMQIATYGIDSKWKVLDCQFFNSAGAGISLYFGTIWAAQGCSGARNAIGLEVADASDEGFGGQQFYWEEAANLPKLLGTTANIRIKNSGVNYDLDWSAPAVGKGTVPFADNRQEGSAQLSLGTVTIPARAANIQRVHVTKTTPAGTPQGVLVVTAASATSFTVQARDLATGALVTTDTSTFSWTVEGWARLLRIAQGSGIQAPPGVA